MHRRTELHAWPGYLTPVNNLSANFRDEDIPKIAGKTFCCVSNLIKLVTSYFLTSFLVIKNYLNASKATN